MKAGNLLFAVAMMQVATALGGEWTVIRQQDRDYVTFANVAQFYQFSEYTRVSSSVSLHSERRRLRAEVGASEIYINGFRFFTDFPISNNGDDAIISAMDVSKIIEPVLRPSRLQKAQKIETVVLDPGHGGTDTGASNHWGNEKAFALDVALTAREELLRAGFKVEMTRNTDVAVSLEDRVAFANRFANALFISIHFNSSGGGSGVESYAMAPDGVPSNASSETQVSAADMQWYSGNAHDGQNMALTAAVHAAVLSRLSAFDRGVKHARFHVLRNVKIPGLLFEGGFLSDPSEGQRIATAQYRQQLGTAIAQGVQNYNAAVNYRASGPTFAAARIKLPPHEHSITEPLPDEVQTRSTGSSIPDNGDK